MTWSASRRGAPHAWARGVFRGIVLLEALDVGAGEGVVCPNLHEGGGGAPGAAGSTDDCGCCGLQPEKMVFGGIRGMDGLMELSTDTKPSFLGFQVIWGIYKDASLWLLATGMSNLNSVHLPVFQVPLQAVPTGFGWREHSASDRAFDTGLDQRDVFAGARTCVICGNFSSVHHCHIIPQAELSTWDVLRH